MENMLNIYLFGKKYQVPSGLTIMTAMEYAGYELVRGCGCRNGFCGACATIYRIKGESQLHGCLACQTEIEEGMYVATLPFFPLEKRVYEINEIKPDMQVMMQLYPEIYSCIGCNACTKACTQELNVMQYIAYAQRGEYEKCAEESFDCVMCGVCSSRCPAGISHPQVAMLARRLNGKYIAPECEHLADRVNEINEGIYDEKMAELMSKAVDSVQELKDMYNHRDIEK
ncbi:MAG: 4Fe-4S dicluster domain-containing protein [Ruminococcus sp.]|nr:4Fe-4S dicluster domain-containing protein [Ruminococcus sp.]